MAPSWRQYLLASNGNRDQQTCISLVSWARATMQRWRPHARVGLPTFPSSSCCAKRTFHIGFKDENIWQTSKIRAVRTPGDSSEEESKSSCVKRQIKTNAEHGLQCFLLTLRFNSTSSGHRIYNHLNWCQQPLLCFLHLQHCSCLWL